MPCRWSLCTGLPKNYLKALVVASGSPRLVSSAVFWHLEATASAFPRCFANYSPARTQRAFASKRQCNPSSSIQLLLASSIEPADSDAILKLLDIGEGPRLAYIGTARTAPRKDSDRPLKDQRKKRRYEARHRSKLLGQALAASSVEHIFLEDREPCSLGQGNCQLL